MIFQDGSQLAGSSFVANNDCFTTDALQTKQYWSSHENLVDMMSTQLRDPNIFVALYPFESGGTNQLTILKGWYCDTSVIVFILLYIL